MRIFLATAGIAAALAVAAGPAAAEPLPLSPPAPIATSAPVGTSGPVVLPPQTSAPYTGSVQPGTPCQASCGTPPPWLS
ncbi:hypothetical protein ACFV4K_20895 [Nocardia sp. NPDC059764]|uniref:hypothetical protein n=1 Tax=Nocardia sp. NPDC059764 TaxID=3346939 RepID=UPI00365C418F